MSGLTRAVDEKEAMDRTSENIWTSNSASAPAVSELLLWKQLNYTECEDHFPSNQPNCDLSCFRSSVFVVVLKSKFLCLTLSIVNFRRQKLFDHLITRRKWNLLLSTGSFICALSYFSTTEPSSTLSLCANTKSEVQRPYFSFTREADSMINVV